jgi:hypothetical protein
MVDELPPAGAAGVRRSIADLLGERPAGTDLKGIGPGWFALRFTWRCTVDFAQLALFGEFAGCLFDKCVVTVIVATFANR